MYLSFTVKVSQHINKIANHFTSFHAHPLIRVGSPFVIKGRFYCNASLTLVAIGEKPVNFSWWRFRRLMKIPFCRTLTNGLCSAHNVTLLCVFTLRWMSFSTNIMTRLKTFQNGVYLLRQLSSDNSSFCNMQRSLVSRFSVDTLVDISILDFDNYN